MIRRIGKFYLPREYIMLSPHGSTEIFKHCAILRAELLFHQDRFEYIAVSHQFNYLPKGAEALEYTWKERNGQFWAELVDDSKRELDHSN